MHFCYDCVSKELIQIYGDFEVLLCGPEVLLFTDRNVKKNKNKEKIFLCHTGLRAFSCKCRIILPKKHEEALFLK